MKTRIRTLFTYVVVTLALLFSPLLTRAFNSSLADANQAPRDSTEQQPLLASGKGKAKPANRPFEFQLKTIVIDAGHGGKDPGCSGPGSTEKHLTLIIAQAFAERVREQFPAVQVILTRDDDTFIPLYERAAIANRAQADLFVSIHCNALPASTATWGSETYVMGLHTAEHNLKVAKRENESILYEENYEANYDYDPNSPEGHILLSMFQHAHLEQSIRFAERVEYHFATTAQRRSRGVKQAGFVVLKETAMPSALVETGFLTSPKDEAFLLTREGQAKVADALLAAFREYKASLEGGATSAAVASSPPPCSSDSNEG
jgi:N-acetylmuramoyl-L-alanine amidase